MIQLPHLDWNILWAYLVEGRSMRDIQENIMGIPAPVRGGGFEAKKIINHYEFSGQHKKKYSAERFQREFSKI